LAARVALLKTGHDQVGQSGQVIVGQKHDDGGDDQYPGAQCETRRRSIKSGAALFLPLAGVDYGFVMHWVYHLSLKLCFNWEGVITNFR
jgi:hypothetical protein